MTDGFASAGPLRAGDAEGEIRDLPFDTLKIDCSFVANLGHDFDAFAIIEAIVVMAKRLDFWIVAERVEAKEQTRFLADLGGQPAAGLWPLRTGERLAELLLGKQASSERLAANSLFGASCAAGLARRASSWPPGEASCR